MRNDLKFPAFACFATVMCTLTLGGATPAAAQAKASPQPSTSTPHDAMKGTASELYDRAIKAMDEQRWEDCRAAFLAAFNVHPNYQIAGNLGFCEAKLSRYTDAAEHAAFALRALPANAPKERKQGAESVMKEVRPKVAEVTIRVSKPDAEIFVDGRSVGRAPLANAVFVEPGARKLEAKLGTEIARNTVTAMGGGTHEIALTFQNAAKSTPLNPVLIGGGAGLTAVALGVGIGSVVAAGDKAGAAEKQLTAVRAAGGPCTTPPASPRCQDLLAMREDQRTLQNMALWSFVGAGAVGLGTAVYVYVTQSAKTEQKVAIAPAVGMTGGGLWVVGKW